MKLTLEFKTLKEGRPRKNRECMVKLTPRGHNPGEYIDVVYEGKDRWVTVFAPSMVFADNEVEHWALWPRAR